MAGMVASGLRCETVARGKEFLLLMVGLWALWSGTAVQGQDEPKPQEEPITTLHVYTNLIQIPTLVLGPNRERLRKPVAESQFTISIDNGPWFRATHVRMEGDDPISLSILLDVSGGTAELMPKIGDTIARLAPLSLHQNDHISIYALDCSLARSLNDVPAKSAELQFGVEKALESWRIRTHDKQSCEQSIHLWDALAHITGEMSKLPGRRVILAISDGRDKGSGHTWNETRSLAENRGVAVFGLSYIPQYAKDANHSFLGWNSEDPFHALCELSGGVVFLSNTRSLGDALKAFAITVRERYIVEFPRPANATPGVHVKEVRIANSNDFIRPAGVSVPLPDPSVLADPSTVPSDPSRTPVVGTRKPMEVPQ
jgi:hypothetical protein